MRNLSLLLVEKKKKAKTNKRNPLKNILSLATDKHSKESFVWKYLLYLWCHTAAPTACSVVRRSWQYVVAQAEYNLQGKQGVKTQKEQIGMATWHT